MFIKSLCTYSEAIKSKFKARLFLKHQLTDPFLLLSFIWQFLFVHTVVSQQAVMLAEVSLTAEMALKPQHSGTRTCILWGWIRKSHDLVLVLEKASGYHCLEGQFFFFPISWNGNQIKKVNTLFRTLCFLGVRLPLVQLKALLALPLSLSIWPIF